mmetsp:Transcript_32220/g.31640  ORF Transcript_32220/g.31640 Transcript_32220/m.31640 type:complete len:189 (+) Transcript_32220:4379-4945(+)
MKKVPKDQTSLNTETKYEFDCPCSTNYGFEAPASSYKSKSGKAASTGARAGSTSDSTTNNADKCYVNIPAFNDIDTDLSACSNLGFTIIATKNMCPGQANNESDTSGVDFTEVNNALLESSEYKASDYEGSDFLDSSSYEKIQCTGPSLDVSFYCIKGKRKDKDGKLIVQKIDIPKFKNSKTVSFKIG